MDGMAAQGRQTLPKWIPWALLGAAVVCWCVREAVPLIRQYRYYRAAEADLRQTLDAPYGHFLSRSHSHYFGAAGPFEVASSRPIEGIFDHTDDMLTVHVEGQIVFMAQYRPGVGLMQLDLFSNGGLFSAYRGQPGDPFPSVLTLTPPAGPKKGRLMFDYECDGDFKTITEIGAEHNREQTQEIP